MIGRASTTVWPAPSRGNAARLCRLQTLYPNLIEQQGSLLLSTDDGTHQRVFARVVFARSESLRGASRRSETCARIGRLFR